MSRRRGSATALKASEVVVARGIGSIYSHMGICQEESLEGGENFGRVSRGAILAIAARLGRAEGWDPSLRSG